MCQLPVPVLLISPLRVLKSVELSSNEWKRIIVVATSQQTQTGIRLAIILWSGPVIGLSKHLLMSELIVVLSGEVILYLRFNLSSAESNVLIQMKNV